MAMLWIKAHIIFNRHINMERKNMQEMCPLEQVWLASQHLLKWGTNLIWKCVVAGESYV